MDKNLLEELKNILEKEKAAFEKQLEKFAKKDGKTAGDWDTVFPKYGGQESGSAALEKAADEVEEYSTLLPIEHSLEIRLKNIEIALDKIRTSLSARTLNASRILQRGKYGICEKCGKEIPVERLRVSPESRFCLSCKN